MRNVTLRRVRLTTISVEKQKFMVYVLLIYTSLSTM